MPRDEPAGKTIFELLGDSLGAKNHNLATVQWRIDIADMTDPDQVLRCVPKFALAQMAVSFGYNHYAAVAQTSVTLATYVVRAYLPEMGKWSVTEHRWVSGPSTTTKVTEAQKRAKESQKIRTDPSGWLEEYRRKRSRVVARVRGRRKKKSGELTQKGLK